MTTMNEQQLADIVVDGIAAAIEPLRSAIKELKAQIATLEARPSMSYAESM